MKTKAEIDAMFSDMAEWALSRAERDGFRSVMHLDASPAGPVNCSLEIWKDAMRLQRYSTKLQRDQSGALRRVP